MAWIPYLRPGAELAKAISEVVNESHNALLLGNHGMTVWGDTFIEVEELISKIENNQNCGQMLLQKQDQFFQEWPQ